MEVIDARPDPITLSEFEEAARKVDELETIPAVTQQLLAETAKPNCNADEVFRLVSSDPTISARIMRAASSSVFGARAPNNLRMALVRLGTAETRRLVVIASLMATNGKSRFLRSLWEYSLKCAAVTEAIGLECAHQIEDPFLCGLLHDFGCMILARLRGKKYSSWMAAPGTDDQQEEKETEKFGYAHTDVGAMLAASWNLFEALEHVMQLHHTPLVAQDLGLEPHVQSAVYAVSLARMAVIEHKEEELRDELCDRLGIDAKIAERAKTRGLIRYAEMYSKLLG